MDIRQLIDECNAEDVAEYLQMQIVRKGSRNYIACPGHEARLGKPDLHIGNAELKTKGYTCYACHEFVSTHDMVMEVTGCSSEEAYNIMADAMGYKLDGNSAYSADIPRLRLTKEEATVIGIYPRFREPAIQKQGAVGMVTIYDGLFELYKVNPGMYYQIITEKAREAREKYLYYRTHYATPKADLAYQIYDLLGDHFDNSVYASMERELTTRIETCEKIINIFSAWHNRTA